MKNKLIFLLLLCCFLFTVLVGCGKDAAQSVALFDGEDANFMIIRPDEADKELVSLVGDLRQELKRELGVSVLFKPDTFQHEDGQIELNIGITNRPDAQSIYDELVSREGGTEMDWTIQKKGDFIYVIGASNDALENAIASFVGTFCQDTSGQIKSDFGYLYASNDSENTFEFCGSKDMKDYYVVTPQYNMSYLIGREIPELQNQILAVTGAHVKERLDSEKETPYEIVIGNTKREGTPECSSDDEYRIKMEGEKLFICGGSDAATAVAVKEFTRMVKAGEAVDSSTDIKGSYKKAVENYKHYYSLSYGDDFDTFNEEMWSAGSGEFTKDVAASDKETVLENTQESLFIEDGNLVLKALNREDAYVSTEVKSGKNMWYKYGLVEISAKMDVSKGICAAFWTIGLDSSDYHGEFDIFQCFGRNYEIKATPISHPSGTSKVGVGTYYCNAIKPPFDESFFYLPEGESFADEYHTFSLEWDEDSIKWAYDGRVFLEIDPNFDERSKETFNQAMQVVMAVYSGNDIALETGFPNETTDWSKNYMQVDYFRLYQLPGQEMLTKQR